MAQLVMFPPQSNSKVTELAAEITSSDNVITVVAGNLLPDAPNVVTLGLDELAETIYYTTKSGNVLSGVFRGFDGTTPKGWSVGTRVARYLTAQDISALQQNVSDHETRISGITTEKVNKITPKLVDDLPAVYPIGLSLFSLSFEASGLWKTAIGYPGNEGPAMVQTAKANDGQYSIVQRVTFSTDTGITTIYERSSTANNSWNGAWIKVVSRSEYDSFKSEVDAHLADFANHEKDYVRQPAFASTSGTSTAYAVTLNPVPDNLPAGFGITIVPHVDCGASPTLNINGLGAKALKDQKGVAFAAGKLTAGKPYTFRLVGTDFLADSGSGGGEEPTPGAQTFAVAGTYNFVVPPGISRLIARIWGAGGGGGGSAPASNIYGGGGGGAGAFMMVTLPVTPGQIVPVVVGAGGIGGVGGASAQKGGTGGTSSVGSIYVYGGGGGGNGNGTTGGGGGGLAASMTASGGTSGTADTVGVAGTRMTLNDANSQIIGFTGGGGAGGSSSAGVGGGGGASASDLSGGGGGGSGQGTGLSTAGVAGSYTFYSGANGGRGSNSANAPTVGGFGAGGGGGCLSFPNGTNGGDGKIVLVW